MSTEARGQAETLALMERIATCLHANGARSSTELAFQDDVAEALKLGGLSYRREFVLSPRDRVDFLCDGVGLELKIGGSSADVLRQLSRYTTSPKVDGLLLVTSRILHTRGLPDMLGGKPLRAVYLGGTF